jgi:hypothetical protein
MGEEAESILKPLLAFPGPFRDSFHLPKIFRKEGDNPIGFPVWDGMRYDGLCSEDGHRRAVRLSQIVLSTIRLKDVHPP